MQHIHRIILIIKDKILTSIEYLLMSSMIFFIIYVFVAQLVQVAGVSMSPTLHDKDQLLAEKISLTLNNVNKGDIIIFNSEPDENNNSHLLVKRVIATQGDTIKFENGFIYLNDKLLQEEYLENDVFTNLNTDHKVIESNEYLIGEDSYFVLGDNRDESNDSRYFGSIHKSDILGKVILRYLPIKDFKIIK